MAESNGIVDNRGPVVLAVTTALLVASTTFVALRLVSRIGVVKNVSIDDYFIVLAWLIAFGFSFAICYGTSVGLGRHDRDVKLEWQRSLKQCEYAFSVLYNPALMATKTSICLFYLTLSKNQQIFKWSTIATLIVVNLAGTSLTFLNIFQCRPVSAAFEDPTPSAAKCIDIVTLYLSSAPVNIITDLALLFLPMPILTAIRLPRNEKMILIVTFSFGAFVAVVDVIRIAYLQSASVARLQNARDARGDFSWIASLSFMWSAIEVHVGIICACVPGVKPLVAKVFPNLLGRIKHTGNLTRDSGSVIEDFNGKGTRPSSHYASPPVSPVQARRLDTSVEGGEMGMMDFLTTPETIHTMTNTQTATTNRTKRSRAASLTAFDFVNTKNPKSMVKMNNREALGPLAVVTILFFLWGFAYGLLDILNSQFQRIVGMRTAQSIGLHSAYFGAYFVAPLTFGRVVFRKWGFKATFIVGLCIYACGTLVFWPSAVLASYPAFLISNFIVGLGVATLETAGNPFITLCGPPEYAEARLNISQAVQAIGTVFSPILAKKVLFKNALDVSSLIDIQWTYLGIALFDVVLAVIFYYLPIPEASDEDLDEVANRRADVNQKRVGSMTIVHVTLAFGIFSQFCYVGGQEAVAVVFQKYVDTVRPRPKPNSFDYQAIGHAVFAIGRFLSAMGCLIVKPRRILLFLFLGLIITSVLSMNLSGYTGVAMIVLVLFFESGIFSTTFAMCIRGLGAYTKSGSILLTAATSGGAVVPAIMSPVTDRRGVQYSFCVVVAFFAFGALLPIYTETVSAAKAQVDPVRENSSSSTDPPTPSRAGRVFAAVMRRKKRSSELPRVEHVEGQLKEWPG
ncbi:hypothetical protein MMC07_006664 [Pseudocyphellaria aurata]|nr:hypothetical protein [Pseudocyphellaria aurata]